MARVLVVDDQEQIVALHEAAFQREGHVTRGVLSVEEALAVVDDFRPDAAIVDLKMTGRTGLTLIEDLRQARAELAIVVVSGVLEGFHAIDLTNLGADAILHKPMDMDQLYRATIEQIQHHRHTCGEGVCFPEILRGKNLTVAFEKTCPHCKAEWSSLGEIIHDRSVKFLGWFAASGAAPLSLCFQHLLPDCGTTFLIPVDLFSEDFVGATCELGAGACDCIQRRITRPDRPRRDGAME